MNRVPTRPEDRQQELAEIALEIEAELATGDYEATPEELAAIDEGLVGKLRAKRRLKRPSLCFAKHEGRYSKRARPTFDTLPPT